MWDKLTRDLSDALGRSVTIRQRHAVGGGCIHETSRITTEDGSDFFVKANGADQLPVLQAEAEGLRELAKSGAIRTPEPLCHGMSGGETYLVLEFIQMQTGGDDPALGRQLAEMHRHTAERFGWEQNNFIGKTVQPNVWSASWPEFYREHRLRHQFGLAAQKGAQIRGADRLLNELEAFFADYSPAPSLLHGDLWGGNAAFDSAGAPVIFDPAVYYGDREADLAMTELFGGFSPAFYAAYDEAWPRDAGYSTRKALYNLYHVLNHFNTFGGGYAAQAQSMVDELLATIR